MRAAAAIVVLACWIGALAHAQERAQATLKPSVEQPRAFGYTLGDVLTQRILLDQDAGSFEPAQSPRYERIGVWLERREPRVQIDGRGQRWLAVDYQIVTSPQTLMNVVIPAWTLGAKSGIGALSIDAWTITVSPLSQREAFATMGVADLRPDRPAVAMPTTAIRQRIAFWSAAAAMTLLAWTGWYGWRGWRAASGQPFARALRQLRGLDATAPEAWRALHRAFDATGGLALQPAVLDAFFAKAPQWLPLRPDIERFFSQSTALFFGDGLPADAITPHALCRQLRRIEKRLEE